MIFLQCSVPQDVHLAIHKKLYIEYIYIYKGRVFPVDALVLVVSFRFDNRSESSVARLCP